MNILWREIGGENPVKGRRIFFRKSGTYAFSSITNKMQHYTIYLFLWNVPHVSAGIAAHHQELNVKSLLLPATTVAGSSKGLTTYPMLYIQFWAPDDGRRYRRKHMEHFTEINKLCKVASCWLYLKIRLRCTDPWTSNPEHVLIHADSLIIPL